MDLATGAMGSLLLKLGVLLTEEHKLQTAVKQDVEYLKRELESMYAALRKVGDVPRDELDLQVKIWADEVRNLSYTMEDIVDKFLVRVEGAEPAAKPHKLKKLMKKMGDLFTKGKTRHGISEEIKDIKVRVQEAADRRDRYKVNDVAANPDGATSVDPRLSALYKDQKDLVGIDGALKELTKIMLSHGDGDLSKHLKMLSIFGFGGLGKTTLAKALYDKLEAQFDCSAFVPVGQNPSVRKILNDIIYGIDKEQKDTELDERQLIDKLRELLKNKRYLVVIDDIWDTKIWEIVRCALVDNNCASRIVTTTRILEVATKAGEVYRLQPLSHDLSRDLFLTRLCDESKPPDDQPEIKVCRKILHKCGGVPLAIITMASLLVGKPVEFWPKIYNSIGFGHEDNNDVDNTRKILLYSYYDLPCHLRTCLLHLSMYPEDYFIEKDRVIWMWVAEGIVHEEQGVGSYEIGERYFNQLINKSMILPVGGLEYRRIGCRVHDMVLDIICLLSKEENFVTILDNDEQYTSSHSNARRFVIRRRSQPLASTPMPQVRSFNVIGGNEDLPLLSCFQVLRVLAIEYRIWPETKTNIVEHLEKLVHLRYVGLSSEGWCITCELPKEIGNLKFLQVLDLDSYDLELPESVGQLSQLKCLRAKETTWQDWIGNLTSLEELWIKNFGKSSNSIEDLGKLTELRDLRIRKIEFGSESAEKAWVQSICKLHKIQVIDTRIGRTGNYEKLQFYPWEGCTFSRRLRVLHMSYRQHVVVEGINSSLLPYLTHLTLNVDNPDIGIFARFRELVSLTLDVSGMFVHREFVGGAGAFPKLRFLKMGSIFGRFLEGDLPSLEYLQFIVQFVPDKVDVFHLDSLVNLPLLREVILRIYYIPGIEIEEVEAAARHAVDVHPNRPKLDITSEMSWSLWQLENQFMK